MLKTTPNGAVAGGADAGKSTLVAVLSQGARGRPGLDDGRGAARLAVLRHKHEIETGRTSSICQQVRVRRDLSYRSPVTPYPS